VDCFLELHSEVTTVIGNNGGRPNIHLRWLETLFDDLRVFQEYLQCTWLVKDQK
jgi:hypothetical protein